MKIGITISDSKTQCYINQAYIDYIHEAGMQAFMITKNHSIDMITAMLDGLILPGGIDLDPIYYGIDNYTSYGSDFKKDEFERAVFHAFRKAGKPIFGICRGFQLMIREYLNFKPYLNNFLDFWTDIPGHNQVADQQLARTVHQHFVNFLPSLLYGKTNLLHDKALKIITDKKELHLENTIASMPVNSMHHQGLVADFGGKHIVRIHGFELVAWTARGLKTSKKETSLIICEAFRIVDWGAPMLAVQWHPEELKDINLLRNFFLRNNNKGLQTDKIKKKGVTNAKMEN